MKRTGTVDGRTPERRQISMSSTRAALADTVVRVACEPTICT